MRELHRIPPSKDILEGNIGEYNISFRHQGLDAQLGSGHQFLHDEAARRLPLVGPEASVLPGRHRLLPGIARTFAASEQAYDPQAALPVHWLDHAPPVIARGKFLDGGWAVNGDPGPLSHSRRTRRLTQKRLVTQYPCRRYTSSGDSPAFC